NEAYEILKDPDKRAAYDRFGHAAFEQGMGNGAHDFPPGFGSAFADIFEGIFGMAGGRGRGNRAERGADLRYNMEITLEEAFAGEGEAGVRGGPSGDLYIFLSIATHAFFQRDGADLHCRVPISMVQAALGGEFEVPTIEGDKTRVKVPEGTQSGRRFRLHGKGM